MADSGRNGRWNVLGRPARLLRTRRARVRREQRGEHAPDLWNVWKAAPVVLVVGCAGALLVYWWLHGLAVPIAVPGGRARVDSLEVIKTTFTVLAFVGALFAGLYAYRKQLLAEGDASRADAQQFADRYSKAADQLGSDQAAIRLAGVYAMARLGDDWKPQRQTCVDVLCAYLRMPYQPPGAPEHRLGEDQVRKTIVRVIAAHLQPNASPSWSVNDFDFTGAYLEEASFKSAIFSGHTADFAEVTFSGYTWFDEATFSSTAEFEGATFSDGAAFVEAKFSGEAIFRKTKFSKEAWFVGATFSDSTWFDEATFSEDAWFQAVTFGSSARFDEATFSHTAWFFRATFSGIAVFKSAAFAGGIMFDEATFSSTAEFEDVVLGDPSLSAALSRARLRGRVTWGPFTPVPGPSDDGRD